MDKDIELSIETLSGDIRDALLTHLRDLPEVWAKLAEAKQQERIDAVENMAESLVRRAVALVAASGFDTLQVSVKDFAVKGGTIKGKFEAPMQSVNVLHLAEHENQPAYLVLTAPSEYMGERAPAAPDPDEPEMFADDPEPDDPEPDDPDPDNPEPEDAGDIPASLDRRTHAEATA